MPIATLLIALLVTGPRLPDATTSQSAAGTAVISGTVVTMSSGQAIAGATVTIYAPVFPDGRLSTTTDDQGRFELRGLAAGRYVVGALKTGYVTVTHGQRRPGGAGRAIPLRDGERRDLHLHLPRTSAITGLVVDERGNPAVNARVRAVRFSLSSGYQRAELAGSAPTDDRGIYRIHSLQPGDYAVCASTHATGPLNEAQRLQMEIDRLRKSVEFTLGPEGVALQQRIAPQLAALEARLPDQIDPVLGYGAVCHPGTAALPSIIRVTPDEDRSDVDLQFALTRLARIEGVVMGIPRDAEQLFPIQLVNADETLRDTVESARPNLEGRFRFTNVPPGRYRLILESNPNRTGDKVRIGAAADVVVAGEDIEVALDPQPGTTIAGQVVFRGAAPPAPALMTRTMVRTDPEVPGALSLRFPGTSTTSPDETGQFLLTDVFPGRFRISADFREPTGWFVDSATLAGEDVLDQPLDVKPNQRIAGVVVTLTDQRAELAGSILNENGEPAPEYMILVYPSDERHWTARSRRMFATRGRRDGTFVITGLRPGDYRVATLLDPLYGVWFDPSFLRQLAPASMPLSIAGPGKKTLNLRVPSGM